MIEVVECDVLSLCYLYIKNYMVQKILIYISSDQKNWMV